MSRDEQQGLNELYQDVVEADLPDPGLLARYAVAPNELSAEERLEVETAMRRSPAVQDELDTLRGFDFAELNADLEAPGRIGILSTLSLWIRQPSAAVALAAAAAILLWFVVAQNGSESPQPTPQIAEQPAPQPPPPSESSEQPRKDPILQVEPANEGSPQLAEIDPPPASSTPEPPVEPPLEPTVELAIERPTPDPTPAPIERVPDPEPEILLAMLTPRYESPFDTPLRSRAGATYRSGSGGAPFITILAPAHVAWSSSTQPTFYWHSDQVPSTGGFYLTISDSDDNDLVENRRLPAVTRAGIQAVSLRELDVELRADQEYRWSIAHRVDDESPPTHHGFGWIRSVELEPATRSRIEGAQEGERPAAYAESGYWYDALQSTIALVDRYPLDPRPRESLQSLLDQGKVDEVAD